MYYNLITKCWYHRQLSRPQSKQGGTFEMQVDKRVRPCMDATASLGQNPDPKLQSLSCFFCQSRKTCVIACVQPMRVVLLPAYTLWRRGGASLLLLEPDQ